MRARSAASRRPKHARSTGRCKTRGVVSNRLHAPKAEGPGPLHLLEGTGPSGWLGGQDLNLRPSGYEGDFTQPADGRRHSCFQSFRVVRRSWESTEVHIGIPESPLVWTRSGQSLSSPRHDIEDMSAVQWFEGQVISARH